MPSGTMCNEIAIRVHTQPGDAERGDDLSHRWREWYIQDGAGPRRDSVALAKDAGLATHMDGARLLNAVVKSGVKADQLTEGYDSCWTNFSKGLGAPVGAVLAGSSEFIRHAWRMKQQMGGALRQSGILAAMCLYALDHNVDRLADDYALVAGISARLSKMDQVANVLPVETNIVIFDLSDDAPDASEIERLLKADGVIIGAFGERRIRVVTHLDVDAAGGDALCESLEKHLKGV